jgi:hypothetical protein
MEAILAVAILFALWVMVIWGSMYFNHNVVYTRQRPISAIEIAGT